jgi:mycofactocin system transcriptional regulator
VAAVPRLGRRPVTTHGELEEIAFGLFARAGFDATSIDDIAAAGGIARRTFFRYYPSKTDIVWGDVGAQMARMRTELATVAADVPVMEAVHRAVIEYNRIPAGDLPRYRERLTLILGVPTLLANSTLRFVEWREVIATFAAGRLAVAPDDLLPQVMAHSALGAALAACERWLADPAADLLGLLDEALGELATGFRHHGQSGPAA